MAAYLGSAVEAPLSLQIQMRAALHEPGNEPFYRSSFRTFVFVTSYILRYPHSAWSLIKGHQPCQLATSDSALLC